MKPITLCPRRRRRRHQDRRRAADPGGPGAGAARGGPGQPLSRPRRGPGRDRRAPGGSCARRRACRPTATAAADGDQRGARRRQRRGPAPGLRRRRSPAFAARRLSSDGYTAFLGVFGTAPGAMLSIGTGVVAFRRIAGRRAAHLRAAGAFRSPTAAAAPGSAFGSRASISTSSTAAPPSPDSALWARRGRHIGEQREAILAWLARARAAEFADHGAGDRRRRPPPATPWREALLDEGADAPAAARLRRSQPSTGGAALPRGRPGARSTGRGSRRRCAARCCRPSAGPIRSAARGWSATGRGRRRNSRTSTDRKERRP